MVSGGALRRLRSRRLPTRVKQGGNVTAASIITQTAPALSASGAAGPHSGQRRPPRDHRQGRQGCPTGSDLRSPAAGAVGSGRREAVALQADAAERRPGRSRYDDYSHVYDGWLGFVQDGSLGIGLHLIEARELRPPIRESAGTGNAGSGPQVSNEIKRSKSYAWELAVSAMNLVVLQGAVGPAGPCGAA